MTPRIPALSAPELLAEVRGVEEESDCAYLLEEIPKALTQTLDGVTRVATIVRAMKEFAHPEGKEMAAADLNRALLSTLTVARNELKYVADVETEFGDLPLVVCNIGDLNQVFLNLLVNAAHAIAENVKGTGEKGKIRVRTAPEGRHRFGHHLRHRLRYSGGQPHQGLRSLLHHQGSGARNGPGVGDCPVGGGRPAQGGSDLRERSGKGNDFLHPFARRSRGMFQGGEGAMRRVLFVDDEPRILEGLRRMLRPQRHEWEMAFAPGGEAALAMMEASPFDVIVSDMRMPGMDGATLLCRVREHVSPGGAHRAFRPHGTFHGAAGGSRRASVSGQALRCRNAARRRRARLPSSRRC